MISASILCYSLVVIPPNAVSKRHRHPESGKSAANEYVERKRYISHACNQCCVLKMYHANSAPT